MKNKMDKWKIGIVVTYVLVIILSLIIASKSGIIISLIEILIACYLIGEGVYIIQNPSSSLVLTRDNVSVSKFFLGEFCLMSILQVIIIGLV